jgi:hypothetical protein
MFYTEARQLALSARDHRSKPIANHTRAEIIDDHTVGIRLHDTYVVRLFDDGSFELNTGGWYTVTTKERINANIPGGWSLIRVGSFRPTRRSPSRWGIFRPDWSLIGPFFDGIRIAADGTILNPKDDIDEAQRVAADEAYEASLTKYLDAYMVAAEGQIYVDALTQEPEGAMTCWDCAMVAAGKPQLEGRTTEGGDKLEHLRRHVGRREIVPELAWVAMRAKGYSDIGISLYLGSTETYIVDPRPRERQIVRKAIRDYLKARLGAGTSGARPEPYKVRTA